jgi:hypothetical protein
MVDLLELSRRFVAVFLFVAGGTHVLRAHPLVEILCLDQPELHSRLLQGCAL